VPNRALKTATAITDTPLPTSAKRGPGHAPVRAHPNPKIVPPMAYRAPVPTVFFGIAMTSPEADFNVDFLISTIESAAVAMAEPMMPYIRNDWKRNISWMRNHDRTSDLVSTMPKAIPSSEYTNRNTGLLSRFPGDSLSICDFTVMIVRGGAAE